MSELSKNEVNLITHHFHQLCLLVARIDDDKIRERVTKMVRRDMQELRHKTHLLNTPLHELKKAPTDE